VTRFSDVKNLTITDLVVQKGNNSVVVVKVSGGSAV